MFGRTSTGGSSTGRSSTGRSSTISRGKSAMSACWEATVNSLRETFSRRSFTAATPQALAGTTDPATPIGTSHYSSSYRTSTPVTPLSPAYRSDSNFTQDPVTAAVSFPSGAPIRGSQSSGTDSNPDRSTDESVSSTSTHSSYSAPGCRSPESQPSYGFVPRSSCPSSRVSFTTYSPTDALPSIYPPTPQYRDTRSQPVSPIICTIFSVDQCIDPTIGHTPPLLPEEAYGPYSIATSTPLTVMSYGSPDGTLPSLEHPYSPLRLSPTGTGLSYNASSLP